MTARRRVFFAVALALLGITGVLLQVRPAVKDVPLAGRLETFPVTLDGWGEARRASDDLALPDLETPERLVRVFRKGSTTLSVSVGYYAQRPAPPALSLPSRGWGTLEQRVVSIPLDDRTGASLRANLLVLQTDDRRTTILYWYQIGSRAVASEHWYRTILFWNRFAHGQTPSAFVRIASTLDRSVDPASLLTTQGEFARALYGELIKVLPG
ncbi:MAG: exosortase C-terminal domain/associated protein EpsI [Candidatus Rokuibacteriota bacterium]